MGFIYSVSEIVILICLSNLQKLFKNALGGGSGILVFEKDFTNSLLSIKTELKTEKYMFFNVKNTKSKYKYYFFNFENSLILGLEVIGQIFGEDVNKEITKVNFAIIKVLIECWF